MTSIKKKIIIIVFDALPYEQFKKFGYKFTPHIDKADVIKLESLIGYSSGLYPSIWTGVYPDQTNFWTDFKFNPKRSIKSQKISDSKVIRNLVRIFPYLPTKISQILSLVFFLISAKLHLFQYKYPAYFNFKIHDLFAYEDNEREIFYPKRTNTQSLFSKFRENDVNYKFIYSYHFIEDFNKFEEDVIIYVNSIADTLGHKHGPNSKIYMNLIETIFKWIGNINLKKNFKIIFFSDHGMTPVKERFYPLKILKELNLKPNKDVVVWLDSTMLRLWFCNTKSFKKKKRLIDQFNHTKKGHFLTKSEKIKYGLNFKNRYFGDEIFLVDPYYEIFPNFFNINPFKKTAGLHGYIPNHKSSYGLFYSNFIKYKEPMSIIDLYKIFIDNLISKERANIINN